MKIAVEMVDEGVITQAGGGRADRARPGRPAPPGDVRPERAQGRDADRQGPERLARRGRRPCGVRRRHGVEWVERGEKVILVRIETSPDDFHGMAVAQGIITARGGATSHAAVVARQIGKPCVAGSADADRGLRREERPCNDHRHRFKEGDWVSLDGSTGEVCTSARCRRSRLGSRTSPSSRRSSAGPTRSGGWASGRMPTSPRRPPRRGVRRRGHRPVPHRAHVPRGRAARDRPRRDPRRQRGDPGQGKGRRRGAADRGRAEAVATFDGWQFS